MKRVDGDDLKRLHRVALAADSKGPRAYVLFCGEWVWACDGILGAAAKLGHGCEFRRPVGIPVGQLKPALALEVGEYKSRRIIDEHGHAVEFPTKPNPEVVDLLAVLHSHRRKGTPRSPMSLVNPFHLNRARRIVGYTGQRAPMSTVVAWYSAVQYGDHGPIFWLSSDGIFVALLETFVGETATYEQSQQATSFMLGQLPARLVEEVEA